MPTDPAPTTTDRAFVMVLSSGSTEAAQLALRYASTAAAMDMAVELHLVSTAAVGWLQQGEASAALLPKFDQAVDCGVRLYACPAALAERGLRLDQLIGAVSGVRGAASLLEASLAPHTRLMSF